MPKCFEPEIHLRFEKHPNLKKNKNYCLSLLPRGVFNKLKIKCNKWYQNQRAIDKSLDEEMKRLKTAGIRNWDEAHKMVKLSEFNKSTLAMRAK